MILIYPSFFNPFIWLFLICFAGYFLIGDMTYLEFKEDMKKILFVITTNTVIMDIKTTHQLLKEKFNSPISYKKDWNDY